MLNFGSHSDDSPSQWAILRNTQLQAPLWFFKFVVKDDDYDAVLTQGRSARRSKTHRAMCRLLWFWPRIDDARGWAGAAVRWSLPVERWVSNCFR